MSKLVTTKMTHKKKNNTVDLQNAGIIIVKGSATNYNGLIQRDLTEWYIMLINGQPPY